MISRLFKLRPYRGGPHFDRLSTLCFDLEGIALELTLPASDAKWENPPRPLNYPFNTAGWFETNSERSKHNNYVHLHTEIWAYFPARFNRLVNLMAMGGNESMGKLSFGIQLNKLGGSRTLDLNNPRSLGDYIKWEYDDYYESSDHAGAGKGKNYRYRKEYEQRLLEKGENYRDQYAAGLAKHLEPIPNDFNLINMGGSEWTGFQLRKLNHMSTQYLCIPLSAEYFLQIHIRFIFDASRYREVLEPDMLRAAEWLKQHIKITFPGKPAGPLALPQ